MSGSYRSARTDILTGDYLDKPKHCLIENMGDAWEAMEEMLWLVENFIGEEKASKLINENLYPHLRGDKKTKEIKALPNSI